MNDTTFSNEALQIALDYNLTILGTSDIHGIVDWQYRIPSGGHIPVTLVFAREKTKTSLKRSLQKGQTVVWFKKKLIGKGDFLIPLINSTLEVKLLNILQTPQLRMLQFLITQMRPIL